MVGRRGVPKGGCERVSVMLRGELFMLQPRRLFSVSLSADLTLILGTERSQIFILESCVHHELRSLIVKYHALALVRRCTDEASIST